MRSRTRASLVLMVVLALVAALAPAAFAGKPPKPDKPVKPGEGLSVEVEVVGAHEPAPPYVYDEGALGYPFYWVNALGDQMRFVLTIEGATTGTVSWAIGGASGSTGDVDLTQPLLLPPRGQDPYTVDVLTEVEAKVRGQVQVVHSVEGVFTVVANGETKVVPFTLDADLEPDCEEVGLTYDGMDGNGTHTYSGVPSEVCRWMPAASGYWEVALSVPADATRIPPSIGATLRDHVPGNWCTTDPDNAPGGVGGDPRQGPVEGWFYLPETGICLGGGAGGFTMAVGNTSDFILVTDGHITLTGPYQEVPTP